MISLKDARLTDGLPEVLKKQPEAQALSYAIQKVEEKEIWPRIEKLKIYADISSAPDGILDALAQELQVPAYRQTYPIDTKRELVKGAITYWTTAGNAQVVEDLCRTIFGDAEVIEWWNFGSEPGTYKVRTTNPAVSAGDVEEFGRAAESIKRLSQHLISIDLELSVQGDLYAGGIFLSGTTEIIKEA